MQLKRVLLAISFLIWYYGSHAQFWTIDEIADDRVITIVFPSDTAKAQKIKSVTGKMQFVKRDGQSYPYVRKTLRCGSEYDTLGRITAQVYSQFCFDAYGVRKLRYEYLDGRIVKRTKYNIGNNIEDQYKYSYDSLGHLKAWEGYYEKVMFDYDSLGALVKYTESFKNSSLSDKIYTFEYDKQYKLVKLLKTATYCANRERELNFLYDSYGRVLEILVKFEFGYTGNIKFVYATMSYDKKLYGIIYTNQRGNITKKSYSYVGNKLKEITYYDNGNIPYKKLKFSYKYYK